MFTVVDEGNRIGEFASEFEATQYIINQDLTEDAIIISPKGKVIFPELPWQ